jgi:hypothetical protein
MRQVMLHNLVKVGYFARWLDGARCKKLVRMLNSVQDDG